jgi:hypothetical protein
MEGEGKMDFSGLLLGLFATLAGTNAQELLQGTSDAFTGTLDLQMLVDSNDNATAIRAIAAGKTQDTDLSGFAQGIVLYTTQGKSVVTITSTNFDPTQGGVVDVSYLENGISGTYDDLTVDIEKSGTTWQMLTDDQTGRNVVTQGYFKANKFLGKVIGIESITLSP